MKSRGHLWIPLLNSLRLSDTYICVGKLTIMVQIMVCRLVGTKPLFQPMLEYCLLGLEEKNFSKIVIEIHTFSLKKGKTTIQHPPPPPPTHTHTTTPHPPPTPQHHHPPPTPPPTHPPPTHPTPPPPSKFVEAGGYNEIYWCIYASLGLNELILFCPRMRSSLVR